MESHHLYFFVYHINIYKTSCRNLQRFLRSLRGTSTNQPRPTLTDLIDQGRDSCAVLERIIALREKTRVILIQGNHEEMMWSARDTEGALR